MVRRQKKFESGEATCYLSRNMALKKLQLTLPDFRRLCILKGIYPNEPRNKKKAGKGSSVPKTYYLVKDINYLLHEPMVNKFREFKSFVKKLKRAVGKDEKGDAKRLRRNKPRYKLDHIVRERYPTFIDALRDIEDTLSMCFLFATFPMTKKTTLHYIKLCQRLSVEFMHYVMASKSLKKVFISIKGIYYQAEIMNQTITWVVPHKRGYKHPSDVDYRIMATFVEFYTTLLGFVNYKLYDNLGLVYPPALDIAECKDSVSDKDGDGIKMCSERDLDSEVYNISNIKYPIYNVLLYNNYASYRYLLCSSQYRFDILFPIQRLNALSQSLLTNVDQMEEVSMKENCEAIDEFPLSNETTNDGEASKSIADTQEENAKFQKLFKDMKVFLNREISREVLTFTLRSFGAKVSWDSTVSVGSTFTEDDESITHQIVDRPNVDKKYLSRYYIQPQWVFDCINAKRILSVSDYFPDTILPPHLSPFVDESETGEYVPPEKQRLLEGKSLVVPTEVASDSEEDEVLESDDDNDDNDDLLPSDDNESNEEGSDVEKEYEMKKAGISKNTDKMSVTTGKTKATHKDQKQRDINEEKRLQEMMIPFPEHKRKLGVGHHEQLASFIPFEFLVKTTAPLNSIHGWRLYLPKTTSTKRNTIMLSRYVQNFVKNGGRLARCQSTAVRPQATPTTDDASPAPSSSTSYRAVSPLAALPEQCPVSAYTEWDTLEEVIVGRPDGARVPFLRPEIKATIKPGNWDFVTKHAGKPHHPELVKKASAQVNEFVRVLEMEGVKVRRPDMVNWLDVGSMKTPDFEEGGLHMACPRDSMVVIGNEIIESPMVWRSRYFETRPYKRLLNEYFRGGAKWTIAPKPTMTDDLYRKDYPYGDDDAKREMSRKGEYILTEAEIAFDAADIFRAGRDIFIQISQVTNYSGAEWLKRHLAPDYKVHVLNCEDPCALHIDCTLMPLRPGLLLHNPTRPCQQADKLKKAGWDIIEAPQPTSVSDNVYTSCWLSLNTLSLDEKRVICYSHEKPLIDMFKKLGMTPIPVDMTAAFPFGGAFHCWTVDVRRSGTLQSYFDW